LYILPLFLSASLTLFPLFAFFLILPTRFRRFQRALSRLNSTLQSH
jgi:hypothetical protein